MTFNEFVSSLTELYEKRMAPISNTFGITSMELAILLFLANNPKYDTAKEIVEKRHLTKSHVSISLRDLEERGYIKKEHRNGDNRTVHLVLMPSSDEMIREGQKAQNEFLKTVTCGLSDEDTERLQTYIDRMNENIINALNK